MTILELGRQTRLQLYAPPKQRFVRNVRIGPFDVDSTLLATFPGLDESGRPTISITGVRDEFGVIYIQRQSVSEVVSEQQSFYFDDVAQILYYHLAPSAAPIEYVIFYGLAQGFSDSQIVYIDNVEYLPLIESAPRIRQQQDIENYDRLAFITGTIRISNRDGRLDDLIDQPIYGNDVLLYYLPSGKTNYTRGELEQIAALFVEDYDISTGALSLRIQDRRKSQNATIPSVRFDESSYPNATSEIWGQVVPVLWGQAREIPAIVTNGNVTTGNVTYRAALLLTNIGTVQVFSNNSWTTVSPSSVNLSTGEFQLSAAQAREDGVPLEVRLVNPVGIAITRLTDIIKDINERYIDVLYNDSNYDTDEWEIEEVAISTGGYYLDEEKEIFDVIRDIQNGANVGFRYEVAPDGRRTIRIDDESRPVVDAIDKLFIQNRDSLNIRTNSKVLLAEVVVKYAQSYQSGRWLRYVDNGSAQDVLDIYQQQPRREYDSLLLTEALAQEKAEYLRARFDRVRGIVDANLMRDDFINLRIYDIINIEISPDDDRLFYGTWKAKVLSVEPDTLAGNNRITAVLIEKL